MSTTTETYGPSDQQRIDYFFPVDPTSHGSVAVLVHGGFWREQHDSSQMIPLATYLVQHGWIVANVEYRRSGNGGDWPNILDDIHTALQQVRGSQWAQQPGTRIVAIGHSAGGQLVLLASSISDATVALAPVTDIARTHRENLGEGAVQEFFGASPAEIPEVVREASPALQLPLLTPILVVHGDQDQRVPVEHSRAYVASATSAGRSADYLEIAGAEHFGMIDPAAGHWATVLGWVDGVIA
ncbi:alpha/beta hydrolase [Leucobacter coleopterorum]|uniref:Alpha/beta hydrolase n=1 Tax=Leucobacter coleopterorum TaxID=2714933 RepID=A0ABX6JY89_9MICO|nr:alpha/beta hydrolase [Leucobacter coleopterorum]QIM17735.1 alpha/beta hydrolase [Leucobacter coleopterorum]